MPPQGLQLTPRHYAYLKISEGCNNRCSFCIIPYIRGDLVSRPVASVLDEAERLVKAGTKEILVISQDTSAYGVDIKYATSQIPRPRGAGASFSICAKELGDLGAWIRLHYVYPYPHVDAVIPLMAEGKILPYLDIPFQHASPTVLKAMRRPANQEKTLDRIKAWREDLPGPRHPLDLHRRLSRRDRGGFRDAARLDRGGRDRPRGLLRTTSRSPAPRPTSLPGAVPDEVKTGALGTADGSRPATSAPSGSPTRSGARSMC